MCQGRVRIDSQTDWKISGNGSPYSGHDPWLMEKYPLGLDEALYYDIFYYSNFSQTVFTINRPIVMLYCIRYCKTLEMGMRNKL